MPDSCLAHLGNLRLLNYHYSLEVALDASAPPIGRSGLLPKAGLWFDVVLWRCNRRNAIMPQAWKARFPKQVA